MMFSKKSKYIQEHIGLKFRKTEKLIKEYWYRKTRSVRYFITVYNLRHKSTQFIIWSTNILITGVLIWIVTSFRNPVGFGVAAYLGQHYVEWLVRLIKYAPSSRKDNDKGKW